MLWCLFYDRVVDFKCNLDEMKYFLWLVKWLNDVI